MGAYPFWKNVFDRLVSLAVLVALTPLFLLIGIGVKQDSRGPVFYRQQRIGLNGVPFSLLKFRTMRPASEQGGLLTVGARDSRITRFGYFLRKYKLDELPQFWNVLKGEMSIVGPRPEVEKYVRLYTPEQRKVLSVKPGLTDPASLEYFDENALLAQSPDPEQTYIHEIMPAKLEMNRRYIEAMSLRADLGIVWRTLGRMFIVS